MCQTRKRGFQGLAGVSLVQMWTKCDFLSLGMKYSVKCVCFDTVFCPQTPEKCIDSLAANLLEYGSGKIEMSEFTKIKAGGSIVSTGGLLFLILGKSAKELLVPVNNNVCPPFRALSVPTHSLVPRLATNNASVSGVLGSSCEPKIRTDIVESIVVFVVHFDFRIRDAQNEPVHFDAATNRVHHIPVGICLPRADSNDAGIIFVVNKRNPARPTFPAQFDFAHNLESIAQNHGG
jgi:hypothetical protein